MALLKGGLTQRLALLREWHCSEGGLTVPTCRLRAALPVCLLCALGGLSGGHGAPGSRVGLAAGVGGRLTCNRVISSVLVCLGINLMVGQLPRKATFMAQNQ